MTSFGSLTQFLPDEAATVAAGYAVGRALTAGAVVFLMGELGAGKTTFTRGALRALGHAGSVKSPTYTLCEPYDLHDLGLFCHLDLYRLSNPEELEFFGIRDYVASGAMLFIEWPSRGDGWLPTPDLQVALVESNNGRELRIAAFTADGEGVLTRMEECHA
ncbi:MAG: tRNA (adenosine(37)-N6)-threonylcarbamoyltransferase complex ATPase subunit type 1 TsaE [Pseudomonadota bacterium]|nr:tRNA (adenosine(37)-N6)-threonylcarbamoyltransferase complex ATPase subunit type 1 TsaE [Pseudomonadota bacterium]